MPGLDCHTTKCPAPAEGVTTDQFGRLIQCCETCFERYQQKPPLEMEAE